MAEGSCKLCIHWGPDSGFSDMYIDDLKFCNKWFKHDTGTPVMKITYGSGKGCIFTPADFGCIFFKNKRDCPSDSCGLCDLLFTDECEEGCL